MGATTAVSAEEYLRTSYTGLDREYRDGDVWERTMPDRLHAKVQGLLAAFLVAHRAALKLFVYPEMRVKISSSVYLIPDISVYHPTDPEPMVPNTPPFIAVEILSPDDRMSEVRAKLEEYRQWGVAHVWLIDPHSKRLYTCEGALAEVPTLRIPELNLEVTPADLFE
jgi:Uma2 family endonuclease